MPVFLVRHAQSAPDFEIDHARWPLSELGRRQARALVPYLETLQLQALYTSPYLRASDTLRPFAEAAALPLVEVLELRERDLSPEMFDDFERSIRRCFAEPDWSVGAGGESNGVLGRRMRAAVATLLERHGDRPVAAGSHGQAIAALLASIEPAFGHREWRAMRNPDVFAIECVAGELRWDGRSLRPDGDLPDP